MGRITKEDFSYFTERVKFWVDKLESNHFSWRTELVHSPDESGLALTRFNVKGRWAHVELLDDWGIYPINAFSLNATAFHEVFEVGVLGDIRVMAEDRVFDQEQFDAEIHRIVRLMEKIIAEGGSIYDLPSKPI